MKEMRDVLILNDEHKLKVKDYQLENMIKVLFQNGYKYVVISHDLNGTQYEVQACNLKKENVELDEVENVLEGGVLNG